MTLTRLGILAKSLAFGLEFKGINIESALINPAFLALSLVNLY